MKPFNLERALAGDKVVTRDGREVVQLFYADKVTKYDGKVMAVVEGRIYSYDINGVYYNESNVCDNDLFMAPTTVKVEVWANLHENGCYAYHKTKEDADKWGQPNRIACVHLTGEYEA